MEAERLELSIYRVQGGRLNQLSYAPVVASGPFCACFQPAGATAPTLPVGAGRGPKFKLWPFAGNAPTLTLPPYTEPAAAGIFWESA